MVITQVQFNKAMEEINKSFEKLVKRVEELEEAAKKSEPKPTARKAER